MASHLAMKEQQNPLPAQGFLLDKSWYANSPALKRTCLDIINEHCRGTTTDTRLHRHKRKI